MLRLRLAVACGRCGAYKSWLPTAAAARRGGLPKRAATSRSAPTESPRGREQLRASDSSQSAHDRPGAGQGRCWRRWWPSDCSISTAFHGQNSQHRDLKPSNILLSAGCTALIADSSRTLADCGIALVDRGGAALDCPTLHRLHYPLDDVYSRQPATGCDLKRFASWTSMSI